MLKNRFIVVHTGDGSAPPPAFHGGSVLKYLREDKQLAVTNVGVG